MNPEPPEAGDPEPKASPFSAPPAARRSRRPSRAVMTALIAALVGGGAVAGYLSIQNPIADRPKAPAPSPERGVACPYLREAVEHFRSGNDMAFRQAVAAAAQIGELALDRSGQLFGRPEKLAIELQYLVAQERDGPAGKMERTLSAAKQACADLGRWPVGG